MGRQSDGYDYVKKYRRLMGICQARAGEREQTTRQCKGQRLDRLAEQFKIWDRKLVLNGFES